jgi:hypothetical protein
MRSTAMYPRTAKASGSGTDIVYKFRSIDDNLVGQYSVKLWFYLTPDISRAHWNQTGW